MHDVIVNEEQLKENAKNLQNWCASTEERYKTYLSALSLSRLFIFKSGNFADALMEYYNGAKRLKYQFDHFGQVFNELTYSYLREIDSADDLR